MKLVFTLGALTTRFQLHRFYSPRVIDFLIIYILC